MFLDADRLMIHNCLIHPPGSDSSPSRGSDDPLDRITYVFQVQTKQLRGQRSESNGVYSIETAAAL